MHHQIFRKTINFKSENKYGKEKLTFSLGEKKFEIWIKNEQIRTFNIKNNGDETIPFRKTVIEFGGPPRIEETFTHQKNNVTICVNRYFISATNKLSFYFFMHVNGSFKYSNNEPDDVTVLGSWAYLGKIPKVTSFPDIHKQTVENLLLEYHVYRNFFEERKGEKYIENILRKINNDTMLDFQVF